MTMQSQNSTTDNFDSVRFLAIKGTARKYFFDERCNFGVTPDVNSIIEYLRCYYNDNELPTMNTIVRWHSSWKRVN